MVDLQLEPWDAAATRLLVSEAGGRCEVFSVEDGKLGLVFGAPAIVEVSSGGSRHGRCDGAGP